MSINIQARSLSLLLCLMAFSSTLLGESSTKENSTARIQLLIEQLGAQEYGYRKSAEEELRLMGHAAFNHLLRAKHSSKNPEVQLAVRELLARLPIKWAKQGQPIVDEIRERYFVGSAGQRRYYADWLTKLEDGIGIPSLAKVVRYEQSDVVSKQAVLSLMQNLDPGDSGQVEALRNLAQEIQDCPRTPAKWLKQFAQELETGETSAAAWKTFFQEESALDEIRTASFVKAELLQKWAESAFENKNEKSAREAVVALVESQKTNLDRSDLFLVTTGFWLIEEEQYTLFKELILDSLDDQQRKRIPLLKYCESIIKEKQGDKEEALKLADEAFAMTDDDLVFGNPFFRADTRQTAAIQLEQKEYVDYAAREYRRLIDGAEDSYNYQMFSIKKESAKLLSEMLHDRQREKEAAEVLEKFLEMTDKGLRIDFDDLKDYASRMHFFWSEHHRLNGDRKKQVAALEKAIGKNARDADVLIAMHRLPRADKEWKERTSLLIQQAVGTYEVAIQQLRTAGQIDNRDSLAIALNQVAWLVGNTEGDFEKSVRQSRRSLELRPNNGPSLDTLGRCYYAVGDLENALRYQRRAVRMMPYSKQIVRQLEFFQAESAK